MYRLDESVLGEIIDTLIQPEMGGILGIDETDTVVKFHFDCTGRSTAHRYIPDVKTLNRVIGEWYNSGIFLSALSIHTLKDASNFHHATTVKSDKGADDYVYDRT